MSDFVTRFERELVLAGKRHYAGTKPRSVRRRTAAVVAVAILIVGAPALALTGLWHPTLGDGVRPAPQASAEAPPAGELQKLEVLRRDQRDSDRGPQTQYALSYLTPGVSGVRTAFIRLLEPGEGRPLVLIPVAHFALEAPGQTAPTQRGSSTGDDGLCLFRADQNAGAGAGGYFSCFSSQQLTDGAASGAMGTEAFGLVPDGVARVEVDFGIGSPRMLLVTDNSYSVIAPEGAAPLPSRVTWLGPDGKPLRVITRDGGPVAQEPTKMVCDQAVPAAQCTARGVSRIRATSGHRSR
jgi:hypothetical protein